jgi:hypothetical protein
MFISDPDFYPSRIPDSTILKIQNTKNYRILLFTQKFVIRLLKICLDPGSGKNLFRIPDPDTNTDPRSRVTVLKIRKRSFLTLHDSEPFKSKLAGVFSEGERQQEYDCNPTPLHFYAVSLTRI